MTTNVLLFESEQEFAETLKSGLAAYDCQITVVDDGEAGIALASESPPDLILLTIELPRMNGFSVCNKLKRNANLKKVPLVLLSSEATEETFDQHKRLRTRADQYIHKPVTVEELVSKLDGIVALQKSEGSEDVDDEIEEIAIDDDMEMIEEVEDDGGVEQATDAAFGNLMAPEEPTPAADEVEMEDLELEEGDGLKVAPEAAPPADEPTSSPAAEAASSAPSGGGKANEVLIAELAALKTQVATLEGDLTSAREATSAEADAKAQVIQKKDAEISLLESELEELKRKMESKEGAGTAREFLDLREQLNRKDKEILEIRDRLSSKEKEVIRLNDENISLGRQNADLVDQVSGLESERSSLIKERDAAVSDKEQAQKRGDDYKAKSEKLKAELEGKVAELAQALESHENTVATRDAQEAAMRDDHATALRVAAAAAEEAKNKAVAEAIQQAEERAAGEREAALVAAAEQANRERAEAIAEREVELKAEQDSKLAALHRANEESMRKLRAEHDQASEEAARAAAQRLSDRERELGEEKAAELAEQQSQHEARLAEVDAQRARLANDLEMRTNERDGHAATIAQRDRKVEELEAAIASQRVEVVELGDKLQVESSRVTQAREKWAADEAALRSAKEALDQARSDLEAALGRPMPE